MRNITDQWQLIKMTDGKLNIAQNESLCYFKQLFLMERTLDLKFKNLGLILALPLSTSIITNYFISWGSHLQNENTRTSYHGLVSSGAFCIFPSLQSICYLHVCVRSLDLLVVQTCWGQGFTCFVYTESPGIGKL